MGLGGTQRWRASQKGARRRLHKQALECAKLEVIVSWKLLTVALLEGGRLRPFGHGVATVYVTNIMLSLPLRLCKEWWD